MRNREKIRRLVKSGVGSPTDIAKILGISRQTVNNHLQRMKDEEGLKSKQAKGRKSEYFFPGKTGKPETPPFEEAPKKKVDEVLNSIEDTLDMSKEDVIKETRKKAEEGLEWAELKIETEKSLKENRDILQDVREMGIDTPVPPEYWDRPEVVRSAKRLILHRRVDEFFDLCERYENVLSNSTLLKKFFRILDRSYESMPQEPLSVLLTSIGTLIEHAKRGKENADVVARARERLDLIEKACLKEDLPMPPVTFDLLKDLSRERARKVLLEMVGMERYNLDNLISEAELVYKDELGKLKEDIRNFYEEPDESIKKRIEKFNKRLDKSLGLG